MSWNKLRKFCLNCSIDNFCSTTLFNTKVLKNDKTSN